MQVGCGQCSGCRLKKARDWAARCYHEASMHEENCFITLTYNDEHINKSHSLLKSDFQNFMKKFRKKIEPEKVRYYMCGEYGENEGSTELGRPHYHALIFNYDFSDKKFFKKRGDNIIYTSETLEKIWGNGFTSVGSVSLASAGYVARYTMKKRTGQLAEAVDPETGLKHYERRDKDGEILSVLPEYNDMSRRPGVAFDWFTMYASDVFPDDFIVIKGKKIGTPGYYTRLLEKLDPKVFEEIKNSRVAYALRDKSENTPERLAVREKCQQARTINLKKELK